MAAERFAGKTCLITGAANGIGRAVALRLAAEGAHVIGGDVDEDAMRALTAEIGSAGGSASSRRTDVTGVDDLQALVDFALEQRPSLDLLVANAGILDPDRVEDLSEERFMRTVQANLLHPFAFVRHAAGALRASGGSVILMASTGGLRGIVGQAAYSATKAGVINLTRVLAAELGPAVRVNCICPGWIDTSFNDPIWELLGGREREGDLLARVPLRRQGEPDEVAGAAAFLASDDASYITGHALVVDGGMMAV